MKRIFFRSLELTGPGIDRDGSQKKGIARIIEIILIEKGKLIEAGLLYLLFCIPVLTVPAATAAMVRIMIYMVDDEPRFLWHDFLKAFRENFVKASLIGWGLILCTALMIYSFLIYRSYSAQYKILLILAAVMVAVVLAMILAGFFIYPMIVRTDLGSKAVIKNAFLLLFVDWNSLKGLGVLLYSFLIFLLGLTAFPYTLLIYPLFGIPTVCLSAVYFSWTSVKKYVLKQGEV